MRNRSLVVAAILCIAVGLLASIVHSQDEPAAGTNTGNTAAPAAATETPADKKAPPSPEAMMALWAKYGTPGKEHEIFKSLTGTFNADVTIQMPGAPAPEKSTGTSKNQPVFEGRYLHQDFAGSFMGKPFNGKSLWAYDKLKEKYVNLWIDDMSTMVMIAEGKADSSGKVITVNTKCTDIMDGKEMSIRNVLTVADNDNHTYESYQSKEGQPESKCMTIKYTRAQ